MSSRLATSWSLEDKRKSRILATIELNSFWVSSLRRLFIFSSSSARICAWIRSRTVSSLSSRLERNRLAGVDSREALRSLWLVSSLGRPTDDDLCCAIRAFSFSLSCLSLSFWVCTFDLRRLPAPFTLALRRLWTFRNRFNII